MLIPPHIAEDEIDVEALRVGFFCLKTEKTIQKTGGQSFCLQKRQTNCFLNDLRSKDMSNAKHYEWFSPNRSLLIKNLYLQLLKNRIEKRRTENEQKIIHFRICYRGPSR